MSRKFKPGQKVRCIGFVKDNPNELVPGKLYRVCSDYRPDSVCGNEIIDVEDENREYMCCWADQFEIVEECDCGNTPAFNRGQEIRCIYEDGWKRITENKTYKVIEANSTSVRIVDDGGVEFSYKSHLFEAVN